ncbi:MAG: tetratricopeptide repeat protein [Chloroflexi bacterium]|nr:tetratricopeptide repeat protein [Chloroflexota bacterium]
MADDLQKQLERVYALIQREQSDDALQILRPLLEEHNDNADVWWLMANAVDDPRQARRALVNVLKINPRHSRARNLLEKLNESYPPRDDELMMMMELPEADDRFVVSQSESDEDEINFDDPFAEDGDDSAGFDDDEDPFAELLEEEGKKGKKGKKAKASGSEKRKRSPLRTLLLLLVLVLVAVVALVILMGGKEDKGVEDAAAIAPVTVDQIELQDILAATSSSVSASTSPNFGPNSGAVYADTSVGRTLFVQGCVCTSADCQGPHPDNLAALAFEGINLAASRISNAPESIRSEIQGVGVNITSCVAGSTDTLYRAFVDLTAVNEFSTSGDRATFQARWVKEG